MRPSSKHVATICRVVLLLALVQTPIRAQQSVEATAEVEALRSQIEELTARVEELSRQIERLLEAQVAPLDPASSEAQQLDEAETTPMSATDLEYERTRLAKQLRQLIQALEKHLQKISPGDSDKLTFLERTDRVSAWTADHLSFDIKDGMFRFNVGLRAQLDATLPLTENSIFEDEFGSFESSLDLRRFRLFAEGKLLRRWDFKFQIDLGSEDGFMETYIDGVGGPKLKVAAFRIGRFTEPYSLEQITSSNQLSFMERSLPIVAFAPGRNVGVMMHNYGKERRYSWQVSATTNTDSFNTKSGASDLSGTGRITYVPSKLAKGKRLVHLGLSASYRFPKDSKVQYRSYPEAFYIADLVDTGELPAERINLLGLEVAMVNGPWRLKLEANQARVSSNDVGNPTFWGTYVEASHFLTGEHTPYRLTDGTFGRVIPRRSLGRHQGKGALELVARYSYLDLNDQVVNGGTERNLSLGVNWHLTPTNRVVANIINAKRDDGGKTNIMLMRYQLDMF